MPCSSSGPPSPMIFPVAAASSLTCGNCPWLGPGPLSASGSGFSSAVILLLGGRRRHNAGPGLYNTVLEAGICLPSRRTFNRGGIVVKNLEVLRAQVGCIKPNPTCMSGANTTVGAQSFGCKFCGVSLNRPRRPLLSKLSRLLISCSSTCKEAVEGE